MSIQVAILGAGAMIAVAIFVTCHWEVSTVGMVAYRLDRWTGEVVACTAPPNDDPADAFRHDSGVRYNCATP